MKTEGLRVLTTVPAAPTTLYLAWLSSEQHGAMTSGEAKIEPVVGSDFSALSGFVTGKLVVLDLGRRIVMSWRTTDFPREAPDSRVEIFFEALGGSTRVTVLHRDIPVGQGEQYKSTWNDKYFAPMRAFFSKFLPDPRDPPPPRRPIPPPDEDEEEEAEEAPKPAKAKKAAPAKPVVAAATAPEKLDPPEKKAEKPAAAAPQPAKPTPKPAKPTPKKSAPPAPAPAAKTKSAAKTAPPPTKSAPPSKKKAAPPPKPAKKAAPPPKKAAAPAKKKASPPAKPAKKKATKKK